MSPFINIHTHAHTGCGIELVNANDLTAAPQGFYSAGIHPWHIDGNTAQNLDILDNWCQKGLLAAIGEAGIDRAIGTEISRQREIFAAQTAIAKRYRLPMIIHCVRAYSDFLEIMQHEPSVRMIFHGFNGNATTAKHLLRHGALLSFGSNLLTNSKLQETFRTIPNDCIFLETDTKNIGIGDIYNFAADLKSISPDELKQIIFNNLMRVFGNKWETIG